MAGRACILARNRAAGSAIEANRARRGAMGKIEPNSISVVTRLALCGAQRIGKCRRVAVGTNWALFGARRTRRAIIAGRAALRDSDPTLPRA